MFIRRFIYSIRCDKIIIGNVYIEWRVKEMDETEVQGFLKEFYQKVEPVESDENIVRIIKQLSGDNEYQTCADEFKEFMLWRETVAEPVNEGIKDEFFRWQYTEEIRNFLKCYSNFKWDSSTKKQWDKFRDEVLSMRKDFLDEKVSEDNLVKPFSIDEIIKLYTDNHSISYFLSAHFFDAESKNHKENLHGISCVKDKNDQFVPVNDIKTIYDKDGNIVGYEPRDSNIIWDGNRKHQNTDLGIDLNYVLDKGLYISSFNNKKNVNVPFNHCLYLNVDGKANLEIIKQFVTAFNNENLPFVIDTNLDMTFKLTRSGDINDSFGSDLLKIYLKDDELEKGIQVLKRIINKNPNIVSHIGNPPVVTGKYDNFIGYRYYMPGDSFSLIIDALYNSVYGVLKKHAIDILNGQEKFLSDKEEFKDLIIKYFAFYELKFQIDSSEFSDYYNKYNYVIKYNASSHSFNSDKSDVVYGGRSVDDYKHRGMVSKQIHDTGSFEGIGYEEIYKNKIEQLKKNLDADEIEKIFNSGLAMGGLFKLGLDMIKSNPSLVSEIKKDIKKSLTDINSRMNTDINVDNLCLKNFPLELNKDNMREKDKSLEMSTDDIATIRKNNNLYVIGDEKVLDAKLYNSFLQNYKFEKLLFYPITRNRNNLIKIDGLEFTFVNSGNNLYEIKGNSIEEVEIKNPRDILSETFSHSNFRIIPTGGVAIFNMKGSLHVIGEDMPQELNEYLTHNYIFSNGLFYPIKEGQNNTIKIGDMVFSVAPYEYGYKIEGNGVENANIVNRSSMK